MFPARLDVVRTVACRGTPRRARSAAPDQVPAWRILAWPATVRPVPTTVSPDASATSSFNVSFAAISQITSAPIASLAISMTCFFRITTRSRIPGCAGATFARACAMPSSSASIASRSDDANAAGSIPSSPSPQAGTGAPAGSTLIPKWIRVETGDTVAIDTVSFRPSTRTSSPLRSDRASRSERPHRIGHDRRDHALEEDPLDEIDLEALDHQVEHVRGPDHVRLRRGPRDRPGPRPSRRRAPEDDRGVAGDPEARRAGSAGELGSVVRLAGLERDLPREHVSWPAALARLVPPELPGRRLGTEVLARDRDERALRERRHRAIVVANWAISSVTVSLRG